MVGLTVLTLWSLGQNVVKEPSSDGLSMGVVDDAGRLAGAGRDGR
jgi:hypothetical protein